MITIVVNDGLETSRDSFQVTVVPAPRLSATPSSVTLSYASGSTDTVSLTANLAWTTVSSQPWLTASPSNANNSATLNLTTGSANPTTSTRSATLTISAAGVPNPVITVTQTGSPPPGTLTLTPPSATVPGTTTSGSLVFP